MKNQRPTMLAEICSFITSAEEASNSCSSCCSRPKDFTSTAPEMFSFSCTIIVISPSAACTRRPERKRRLPNCWVGKMKAGRATSATIASRQSSQTITAIVVATVTELVITLVKPVVTTCCTPFTSLVRRVMISPLRVVVKKLSGMCRTWL